MTKHPNPYARHAKLLVVHGPNFKHLHRRPFEHYGGLTYEALIKHVAGQALDLGFLVRFAQSNCEGDLIDALYEFAHISCSVPKAILINPGAFAHTSVALRDCLETLQSIPRVEVHLSDVQNREPFRSVLLTAEVCDAMYSGGGLASYDQALQDLSGLINSESKA